MKLDTKQQVLLAFYIEYQKDLPNMRNVNNTALNIDIDVFNIALRKLDTEGYITGLSVFSADNDEFYIVSTNGVKLTRDGIDYVENKFGIKKELTAEDKLKYVIKKMRRYRSSGFKAVWIRNAEGVIRNNVKHTDYVVCFFLVQIFKEETMEKYCPHNVNIMQTNKNIYEYDSEGRNVSHSHTLYETQQPTKCKGKKCAEWSFGRCRKK